MEGETSPYTTKNSSFNARFRNWTDGRGGESNKPQANLYEYITLLQDIYRHQVFQAIPLCDSVLKNYEC